MRVYVSWSVRRVLMCPGPWTIWTDRTMHRVPKRYHGAGIGHAGQRALQARTLLSRESDNAASAARSAALHGKRRFDAALLLLDSVAGLVTQPAPVAVPSPLGVHPSGDRDRPCSDRIPEDQDTADDRASRSARASRSSRSPPWRPTSFTEAASAANVHGLISSSAPPPTAWDRVWTRHRRSGPDPGPAPCRRYTQQARRGSWHHDWLNN
jgi:hypothetical protein